MKTQKTIAALLVCAGVFALTACGKTTAKSSVEVIPYPDGYDLTTTGASGYAKSGDHLDSPYFAHPDFYSMKSTGSLTIITGFKTYQQTTEYTCGPCSALMVLNHYNVTDQKELDIAEIMKTSQDLNGSNKETPGEADEKGEYGTSTGYMVKYFEQLGWNVESSMTKANEDGYSFEDSAAFSKWVIESLKKGTPIMVEWIDWYGHWQDIIGYDTMGTEAFGDDVIIFADPYDTSDHLQDGYYTYPAERFFYMWKDAALLPDDQMTQNWLIATPKA